MLQGGAVGVVNKAIYVYFVDNVLIYYCDAKIQHLKWANSRPRKQVNYVPFIRDVALLNNMNILLVRVGKSHLFCCCFKHLVSFSLLYLNTNVSQNTSVFPCRLLKILYKFNIELLFHCLSLLVFRCLYISLQVLAINVSPNISIFLSVL